MVAWSAPQDHQEHPTAEVALARRKAANALAIDLELVDGDEYVTAHPKRQIGVEGAMPEPKLLTG